MADSARYGTPPTATAPVAAYDEYVPNHYIIYWFFHGFDANSQHEGDWEHIAVRLDATNSATSVAYYQHNCSPQSVTWSSVVRSGTHPIVYSGLGSHASFAPRSNGTAPGNVFLWCAWTSDQTADGGTQWNTATSLVDARGQSWYGYGGGWGDLNGPLGPGLLRLNGTYQPPAAPAGW